MAATAKSALRLVGSNDDHGAGFCVSRGRNVAAIILSAFALASFGVTFVLAAPVSTWQPLVLFAALVALVLIAYGSRVALNRGLIFDVTLVIDLVALAVFGPLPALAVASVWGVTHWIVGRRPMANGLSNFASLAWGILAAAFVLQLFAGWPLDLSEPRAYGALVAAGTVYLFVNFLVGAVAIACVREGKRLVTVTRSELIAGLPAYMTAIILGVFTVYLYHLIGMLAFVLFTIIVVVPQVLLPLLLRPKPITELTHSQAVAIYARALATELGVNEHTKTVLKYAAAETSGPGVSANGKAVLDHLANRASDPGDLDEVQELLSYHSEIVEALLYANEHWDLSNNGPLAGVGGEMLPHTSRILAVANQWAILTTTGSWTVTHAQAIKKMAEQADTRFDPNVVMAAARVVAHERLSLSDSQPQVHEVPLPKLVGKMPRVGDLIAALGAGNEWDSERTHP